MKNECDSRRKVARGAVMFHEGNCLQDKTQDYFENKTTYAHFKNWEKGVRGVEVGELRREQKDQIRGGLQF